METTVITESVAIKKYFRYKMYHIFLALVLIGAINWGLVGVFNFNLVEFISSKVNSLVKMNIHLNKIIYILVAVAAIKLAMKRDTWLPFLGESVMPSSLIPLIKNQNSDTIIEVKVKPNTRVAYWASKPMSGIPDVITAYDDYSNAGVVVSDDKGIAKLEVLSGTAYKVPNGRVINRHVHYRELDQEWGMVGPIRTQYY